MPADFYTLLGVPPTASDADIERAFQTQSAQLLGEPPTTPGVSERLNMLAEAHRTLMDPKSRASYDRQLALASLQPPGGVPDAYAGRPTIGPRAGARTPAAPLAPDPNAPLRLRLVVGSPVPAQMQEPERLYALAELSPATRLAVPPVAPQNLALLAPRALLASRAGMDLARKTVDALPRILRERDRLTLAFYDTQIYVLLDGEYAAGRTGLSAALGRAGGGQRAPASLAAALDATLTRLAAHIEPGSVTTLTLITDTGAGEDTARCLDLAERARQLGVSLLVLGVGLEWDHDLLDQMATITGGTCVFVDDPHFLVNALADQIEARRASLASRLRLTLEPAPGVSVLRAARVSPELDVVFEGPHTPGAPVPVDLGALAGGPEALTSVALWETLLEPSALAPAENGSGGAWLTLGTIHYSYWALWVDGGRVMRSQATLAAPVVSGPPPVARDVRLAVELLTASRLQARASRLLMNDPDGAAAAMEMSAVRLVSAGDTPLAQEAQRAAVALRERQPDAAAITLRARSGLRNQSMYQHLRHTL